MKKENAIKIITECAQDYHTYLENQNLMFLFGASENPSFFEAAFFPRHFLHLTGVDLTNKNTSGSSDFYKRALKGQLSVNDFSLATDGTTEMKLFVLPQLVKIHRSARMIRDYSFTKSLLYTEKIAGTIFACLGFIRNNKYYIPNTALKEDLRDITVKPQKRVLAIFKKPIPQPRYDEICYTAKGVDFQNLNIPIEIKHIIAFPFSKG